MKKLAYILPVLLIGIGLFAWQTYSAKADVYGSSLVLWLNMDNNQISGTDMTDLSGYGNNGTLINTPTFSSGISGQSVGFNGTNQNINVGNGAASSLQWTSTQAVTFSTWIYINSFYTGSCNFDGLITKGNDINATNGSVQLLTVNVNACSTAGATNFAFFAVNIAGTRFNLTGNTNIKTGQWYHIAGTWASNTLNIYVNGQPDATPVGTSGSIGNNGDSLNVGRLNITGFEYWVNGKEDDVKVYNRALSPAEIQTLYYAGLSQHQNGNY